MKRKKPNQNAAGGETGPEATQHQQDRKAKAEEEDPLEAIRLWKVEALGLLPRKHRQEASIPGALPDTMTRAEAAETVCAAWEEALSAMEQGTTDPLEILDAMTYWRDWPRLVWIHFRNALALRNGFLRFFELKRQHERAEKIIRRAANREGFDSSMIENSGRACRDVLEKHPGLGTGLGWPDCLYGTRVEPADRYEIILRARDVLTNLEDAMENRLASSAGARPSSEASEDRPDAPLTKQSKKKLSWLVPAMVILRETPSIPDAEVARRVGVSRSTLCRSPEYRRAKLIVKTGSPPAKGRKVNGVIEAEYDPRKE